MVTITRRGTSSRRDDRAVPTDTPHGHRAHRDRADRHRPDGDGADHALPAVADGTAGREAPAGRRPARRTLERARDLAGLGAVGARRTRPARYEAVAVEIGPRRPLGIGALAMPSSAQGQALVGPLHASREVERPCGKWTWAADPPRAFGEDGTVQGLLECAGVPTSGGRDGLGVCRDKESLQGGAARAGIRWTEQHAARRRRAAQPFGYPVFVKPARIGSAVGITKARSRRSSQRGSRWPGHDDKVIVEEAMRAWRSSRILGNASRSRRWPARSYPTASPASTGRLLGQVRRGRHGSDRPGQDHAGAGGPGKGAACGLSS